MVTESTKFDLSSVRSVDVDGDEWYCLTDVAAAVGCDVDDPDLMGAFLGTAVEHRSVRMLYGSDGTAQQLPVVSRTGMAQLLLESPPAALKGFAVSVLFDGLASVLRPQAQVRRGAVRPVTQWGEQPARQVMRGKGVSVSALRDLVNVVPGREHASYAVSTLNAVLFGRQLPSADLVYRVQYVLQRPPSDLFSSGVVGAVAERGKAAPSPAERPRPKTLGMVKSAPSDLSSQEGFTPSVLTVPDKPSRVPNPSVSSEELEGAAARAYQEALDSQFDPDSDPHALAAVPLTVPSEEEFDAAMVEAFGVGGLDPSGILPTSDPSL
jgi:hypothetical protein